jgi:hypothetical protein
LSPGRRSSLHTTAHHARVALSKNAMSSTGAFTSAAICS